jgi:hypothetical protein
MLTEVYEFLGRHGTVGRRASVFSVRTEGAEAALDFSLANFPRHLLRVLVAGEIDESTVEFILPDNAAVATESVDEFPLARLNEIWTGLNGNWDGDEFYDPTAPVRVSFGSPLWRPFGTYARMPIPGNESRPSSSP